MRVCDSATRWELGSTARGDGWRSLTFSGRERRSRKRSGEESGCRRSPTGLSLRCADRGHRKANTCVCMCTYLCVCVYLCVYLSLSLSVCVCAGGKRTQRGCYLAAAECVPAQLFLLVQSAAPRPSFVPPADGEQGDARRAAAGETERHTERKRASEQQRHVRDAEGNAQVCAPRGEDQAVGAAAHVSTAE